MPDIGQVHIHLDHFIHGHSPSAGTRRPGDRAVRAERGHAGSLGADPLSERCGQTRVADVIQQISEPLRVGRLLFGLRGPHQRLRIQTLGELLEHGRHVREKAGMLGIADKIQRRGLGTRHRDLPRRRLDPHGRHPLEMCLLHESDSCPAHLDGAQRPVGHDLELVRRLVRGAMEGRSGE